MTAAEGRLLGRVVKAVCADTSRPQRVSFGCSEDAFHILVGAGGKTGRQAYSAIASIEFVELTIGTTVLSAQICVHPTKEEAAIIAGGGRS